MTSSTRNPAPILFPLGLLLIAMASIQTGASLAKSLFPAVGAQGATTLRLIFASIIMVLVLRPWRVKLTASALRVIIVYGMSLGCMNLLFYMALRTVPIGVVVALELTGPLAVAMFSSRKAIDFVWIALAGAGLLMLIPDGQASAGLDPRGAACALGAGACWAAYIVFGQKAGEANGIQTAALGVIVAALFAAPFGIAHAGTALLDISLVPAAIGVAILSTALPYSLEMVALTRMSTRTFGTLASLEPAFGALSGLLFLNEQLSLLQWIAIGAIILASIGVTLSTTPEQPKLVPAD